jgi:hypothetical protein
MCSIIYLKRNELDQEKVVSKATLVNGIKVLNETVMVRGRIIANDDRDVIDSTVIAQQ